MFSFGSLSPRRASKSCWRKLAPFVDQLEPSESKRAILPTVLLLLCLPFRRPSFIIGNGKDSAKKTMSAKRFNRSNLYWLPPRKSMISSRRPCSNSVKTGWHLLSLTPRQQPNQTLDSPFSAVSKAYLNTIVYAMFPFDFFSSTRTFRACSLEKIDANETQLQPQKTNSDRDSKRHTRYPRSSTARLVWPQRLAA